MLGDEEQITKPQCEYYTKTNLKDYLNEEDDSFKIGCANAYSHITNIHYHPDKNIISAFCEYTNYWFYGKLKSTDKITYNEKLLQEFFKGNGNLEYCVGHTEAIDEHTYSYLKKLEKLYEKFYIFEKKPSTQVHNRCEKGDECVQGYKKHKSTCIENGNNRFCNELENFRDLFNTHLKSQTECKHIGELPSFQGSSLAATISIPVSVMSVISFFSFVT
ncbi:VIR-like CYIR protein, partial [Plasmodium cynomolgi strain B]